MTVITTRDVFCDYREDADDSETQCEVWAFGAVGRSTTKGEAREAVAQDGWGRRCGPSRREYDLCPEHAHHVPGGTFPDWRGGLR